jgi:hypothetical protein
MSTYPLAAVLLLGFPLSPLVTQHLSKVKRKNQFGPCLHTLMPNSSPNMTELANIYAQLGPTLVRLRAWGCMTNFEVAWRCVNNPPPGYVKRPEPDPRLHITAPSSAWSVQKTTIYASAASGSRCPPEMSRDGRSCPLTRVHLPDLALYENKTTDGVQRYKNPRRLH